MYGLVLLAVRPAKGSTLSCDLGNGTKPPPGVTPSQLPASGLLYPAPPGLKNALLRLVYSLSGIFMDCSYESIHLGVGL